jgi:hypothetical protein
MALPSTFKHRADDPFLRDEVMWINERLINNPCG